MFLRKPFITTSRPGQVAVEFMLYTTIFMFIVIAAYLVISQLQSSEVPLRQNQVVKETGDGFASIITLAVKGGEGFSYNYYFPKTIFGIPYNINFAGLEKNYMIIDWAGSYGNFSYQYTLPAYKYKLSGPCLASNVLVSTACSNLLKLNNAGGILTITHE